MRYEKPNIEVIELEVADIITQSPFGDDQNGTSAGETVITTPPSWGE